MTNRSYVVAGSVVAALLGLIALAMIGGTPASEGKYASKQELVVFAAGSLRDVFAQLGTAFEAREPGVKVTFSFGGSHELVSQIEHGARADVVATADPAYVDRLVNAGLVELLGTFGCNTPVLIVPTANPAGISTFTELPKASRIVLGTAAVPIGKYSEQILTTASTAIGDFGDQVLARVVSRETTVRHVLTKVALGEADAGIVYRTDAATSKQVRVVEIPSEWNVLTNYPLALLETSNVADVAKRWNEFLTVGEGRKLLEAAGFGCSH